MAVAVDPGIAPDELDALSAAASAAGAEVRHVLLTHADWDHLAGIAAFPAAETSAGPGTAAAIDAGRAAASLAAAAREHGLPWPGAPRCDRVLTPGRSTRIGPFAVEVLPLVGHTADGIAYRIRELDLLVVGDHLSAAEYPFVTHATAAYRATLATLIELLVHDAPATVVPGHGPPLDAGEALEIARDDLAYLRALREAVARALPDEDAARRAGLAVRPPRAAPAELDDRRPNVEAQLAELRP